MDDLQREPAQDRTPAGDPEAISRAVRVLAAAAARMEQAEDLHGAAAPFLSALREHCGFRRVVLAVTDLEGRDVQWFFAGLTDTDIDWFHAHRLSPRDRDGIMAERFRTGRGYSVPLTECPSRAGLREHGAGPADPSGHATGTTSAAEGAGPDLLLVPMRDAGGGLLGTLLLDDGRSRRDRDTALVAAVELGAGQMARLLERRRLLRTARNAEAKLRQAQEQLTQSDKLSAIGQLISEVAHELNNPLSGVLGFTQLVQATETNPKTARHLERISNEALRCQKIVQNLLSFARRHKPEKAPHSLNEVIDSVLDLRAYQLQVDDVEVERHYATDLPPTMLDFHQMQQVVLNLVNNAHQAMMMVGDRPRRLVITTWTGDGMIRASIADTGPGIPKDRLARMFEPFFTTKEPGKGTGLGLSVSLGIIRNHLGAMTLASEPGHGTIFTFEIPLVECGAPAAHDDAAGHPEPAAPVTGAAPGTPAAPADGVGDAPAPLAADAAEPRTGTGSRPPGTGASLRILVVDDEPVLIDLLSDLLRSAGHSVEQARDGRAALRLALERPWDVILSDLKMPGLDGQGLYESACRGNPALRDRFIFTTGDLVNPQTQEFLQRSGCAYLGKPFKLEKVLELVDRAARRRAA